MPPRLPPSYDMIYRFFSSPSTARSYTPLWQPASPISRYLHTRSTPRPSTSASSSLSSRPSLPPYFARPPLSSLYRSTRTRFNSQGPKCPDPACPHQPGHPPPRAEGLEVAKATSKASTTFHSTYLASLPASIRRLAAALPHQPGRPPSRDDLLALTTSFFERLRIRFKWATIRSFRTFRADDYSAFFSFGILGTLGWFAISTTSFFAFVFLIINSLSLQEYFAQKLGDYLTAHTGVTVVFESAIVPKWGFAGGGSKIVFKNVYISRGPARGELGVLLPATEGEGQEETEAEVQQRERMAKWTHFHLSIDTVEVSLSLPRWLDGQGLVRDATVTGVRGVVDRSHIQFDPLAPRDRFAYRHHSQPGDFFLESLKIEDFLVTIYQPDHFRPYTFSIFKADIPRLRKQWLFYDLMSADSITGQVDNCLFSLHKPQSIGRTSEEDLKDAQWSRMSRFRIDGVPIDHMQSQHDTGVLSWVTSGRCDLVADIRFPREESELDLSSIVADIVEKFDKEIGTHLHPALLSRDEKAGRIPGQRSLSRDALEVPREWSSKSDAEREKALEGRKRDREARKLELETALEKSQEVSEEMDSELDDGKIVSIDLDIRFKDLKAHVPYFTSDLSYVNNALIRPIVAFINSNRTLIPIRCHIDLSLGEFDGSWTTYDVGLLDRISEQTYAALAHHVQSAQAQRLSAVSLWTLQLTANAVLNAFKTNLATY